MKWLLVSFCLLMLATPCTALTESTSNSSSNDVLSDVNHQEEEHPLLAKFKEWIEEHGKDYDSHDEYFKRFAIWVENDAYINTHNNQTPKPSWTLGHNHFSDMTNDEYKRYNFLGEYSSSTPTQRPYTSVTTPARRLREVEPDDLPESVNWVEKGALSEVKNQGNCGSCWSFSAVAAVESAIFINGGSLESLSEQQLIDCDHKDDACKGGLMDNAFKYMEKSGGLCKLSDYPYEAAKDKCRVDQCSIVEQSKVASFVDMRPKTEDTLKKALVVQPVSVGIEADKLSFQLYKSGVYDARCGVKLDHGVVAVGYGTDDDSGKTYWTIRNSWGKKWGEKGYIRISREAQTAKGKCGIYSVASRPVLG